MNHPHVIRESLEKEGFAISIFRTREFYTVAAKRDIKTHIGRAMNLTTAFVELQRSIRRFALSA